MPTWLPQDLLQRLQNLSEEVVNRALDRSVRLAVTGLSRSGKTVFITSLVHQLLLGLHGAKLPLLQVVATGRFRGARVEAQPDHHVPSFRYDEFVRSLGGSPPAWPQPTDGISELRLSLRFEPTGLVDKWFGSLSTLYLDIIDYPGEWLLDLPLRSMGFEEWSRQVLERCAEEPRRGLSEAWRDFLKGLDPDRPAEEALVREANALYTEFLHRCRGVGLSLVQPGRFVLPGELKGAPVLTFCPLPLRSGAPPAAPLAGNLHAVMEERFEAYKNHVVGGFYQEHFQHFDRQVVLIDVLSALSTGYANFRDLQEAVHAILQSFRYGQSNLLTRLFQPRIDKLLFAATKADHVGPNQHQNLEALLRNLILKCEKEVIFEGGRTATMAMSAVQATKPVERDYQGKWLTFVRGIPKGEQHEVDLFPGQIPADVPVPAAWVAGRFDFPEFEPPALPDLRKHGLPHIRLDKTLEFLIGDKLL